jgi:chorismate-pyruvate lyase
MPARHRARPRRASATRRSILFPLDVVYEWSGVLKPDARTVSPYDIPLPYRSLLVHESDMTMTLEQHFGNRIGLRVLSTFFRGGWYYRRVLLVQEYSGRPVQMGAIRMDLGVFSRRIRAQILSNEVPLGRILRDARVDFRSQAKVYVAVTPNSEMMGVFWMREPRTLYGRQTEVLYRGQHIGDIVEVLPPV